MDILILILTLFLIFFSSVVFRFIIQRTILLFKLKRFASKNNYNCKIVNPLFFIPLNFSSSGSVLIETESTVYNIKVFGILRKHCEVHFWNINEYSIRKYFFKWNYLSSTPLGQMNCHRRKTGGFNFRNKKINCDYKLLIPIFLFSPTNNLLRVTQMQENNLKELKAGDKIDNIVFADRSYLFWYITNREKREY